ncbi:MAG: hypothetical protein ACOCYT_00555 [Chloroflexota bacterium]
MQGLNSSMTTITLAFSKDSSKLAARIRGDLEAEGLTVSGSVQPGRDALLVVLLSTESRQDAEIQQKLIAALENYQHVIPVLAQPTDLPQLIDNLPPLDFSTSYDRDALLNRIETLTGPDAPPPLVTLTPSLRRSNQRAGLIIAGVVMVMFVLAILGVLIDVFVPPADEFAGVETQIFLTRNWYIDEALPRDTEEALSFEATVVEARETVQPFLILTATGIAAFGESTHYPRSTEQATNFPATLERISTLVQDRMAATVTQLAVTAAAITPTPTSPVSPTPEPEATAER